VLVRRTRKTYLGYEYHFEDIQTTEKSRAILRRSKTSGVVLARFPSKKDAIDVIIEENPEKRIEAAFTGLHRALNVMEAYKTYAGHRYSYEDEDGDIMEYLSQEEAAADDESSENEIEIDSCSDDDNQEAMNEHSATAGPKATITTNDRNGAMRCC
jgi:hypothetical protein